MTQERSSILLTNGPYSAARRAGAAVETDKKITGGANKAHVGTDHQRIAKLDRENEVAPPAKVAPSVGKVFLLPGFVSMDSALTGVLHRRSRQDAWTRAYRRRTPRRRLTRSRLSSKITSLAMLFPAPRSSLSWSVF